MTSAPQLALPLDTKLDGEIRVYRMTFGFLPPSKNVYANWPGQWKSAAKAKWRKAIEREVEAQLIPKGLPRVGLAATLVFPSAARRDPQNYAEALWHWVPDGLVRAGVLVDDAEGCIEIGRNWGLTMAVDRRTGPKHVRSRTVLSVSMLVPE